MGQISGLISMVGDKIAVVGGDEFLFCTEMHCFPCMHRKKSSVPGYSNFRTYIRSNFNEHACFRTNRAYQVSEWIVVPE
ncbi:hypothetical protein JCM12294_47570 [Desulfocicer niacini]